MDSTITLKVPRPLLLGHVLEQHHILPFAISIVDFNYGTNILIFSSFSISYFAVLKDKIVC